MTCDRAGYIESWQSNFKSHNDTAKNSLVNNSDDKTERSSQILDIDRLLTWKLGSNKN